MVGLRGQIFNSKAMYKFKSRLLYNEGELCCTKTELLKYKITLPLVKLELVSSSIVSKGLSPSDYVLVDVELATFLLLSSISDLSILVKTRKFC